MKEISPYNTHQRVGAPSNAHVGAAFEEHARTLFAEQGIDLEPNFAVSIGISKSKPHRFDLGSGIHKILVECKSHRWTQGAKVPSAKMTTWNEAMFYFHLAPSEYRKFLFVLYDCRGGSGESLLSYYRRTYPHFLPHGVQFLEFDETQKRLIGPDPHL